MTPHTHLIILGAPRSGTTLLAAMLGRHPAVAMTHEDTGDAWTRVLGKPVIGVKLVAPNQIELEHTRRAKLRRYARRIHRYRAQNWGLSLPRFKLRSVFSVNDVLGWPTGRILGLIRDPHEGVASIRQRGGHPGSEAEYRWSRALEILDTIQRQSSDRVRLVHYDTLVRDPSGCMQRCLDWLDLPYDPAVLEATTPNYALDGIDPAKAGNRAEARYDHRVFDARPDLASVYERLLAHAL